MATAKKNGLGKGLDSLITNKVNTTKTTATAKPATKKDEKVVEGVLVNINKVEPNREQPRKNFDEDALLELAESIKQFGVLQPLLVQQKDDYYEIIAGERRWSIRNRLLVTVYHVLGYHMVFFAPERKVIKRVVVCYA